MSALDGTHIALLESHQAADAAAHVRHDEIYEDQIELRIVAENAQRRRAAIRANDQMPGFLNFFGDHLTNEKIIIDEKNIITRHAEAPEWFSVNPLSSIRFRLGMSA